MWIQYDESTGMVTGSSQNWVNTTVPQLEVPDDINIDSAWVDISSNPPVVVLVV